MLILLSPSKTLDFESPLPQPITPTQPALLTHSQQLMPILEKLSAVELQKLMDISEKLAALNHQRFQAWQTPFTPQNARPCFYAFKGDVYEGLEAETFTATQCESAQTHLRILSGLYGLLRPFDLIQPYRLEMGTRLTNPRGKNLYAFWGEVITEALNAELKQHKTPLLVNLASEEYFSAIQPRKLVAPMITPIFKEAKGNQLKVVGLFAKKARGMMASYLLKQNITTPNALQQFDAGGYRFVPELSNAAEFIFTRPQPTK